MGMEARVNNYDKIKEDGAGYGLVVEGNSYTRVLGRLGIGVRQEKEWYGWNVKGEYKLLLSKEVPTIKAGFDGSNEKFEVVGNEEGRQVLGVGGGVSCKIMDRVECFANTNYHIGYKYKAMQANIGISYKIGTLTPTFVKRSIKMKKELNKYIYEGLFDKIKQYKKKI
ncbi:autotransporter domain-containing protein [Candidatus Endomicrobiellum devescovinae]|uniref:autotransporter domain-containing protein n=1 Tax=Candidatus Endomicrobiellum devescovinae TaxID=3242322 RepID=UPI0035940C1A